MTTNSSPTEQHLDSRPPSGFSRRSFFRSAGAFLALGLAKLRAATPPPQPVSFPTPLCLATSRIQYPPPLQRFIAKLDPAADEFICERYADEIQPMLDFWSSSLRNSAHDSDAIFIYLSPSFQSRSLTPSKTTPLRAAGPLRIERRDFCGAEIHSREAFIGEWKEYASSFASIESFELQVFGIRLVSDTQPNVDIDIRFNIVGIGHGSIREQRVGTWHLSLARDAQAGERHWTVHRWSADSELRSRLTGPGFVEITKHCLAADTPAMAQLQPGIDFWRTALDGATGIDVYGNHGVSVGDIDNSGYDSFYVCQPSGLPNRLFWNRGDGTFEDITARSGTGVLDGTASALFVDFQNRGRQDLLVVRSGGPLLFENLGDGRFEPRPDAFHFAHAPQGTFTSAAVADYDRNGLLDVYFCVYNYFKGLNHHQYPSPYYDAQNGPPNFLFRNRGDGTFEDVTAVTGTNRNNNRFSFAAEWCDYDNDGWPDLYVANDFGRKNLYHNNGDGTFTDVAAEAGVEDYGPGMSTCWVDIDNDGLQDLYVANMWLPEGKRITENDQFLSGVDPAVRALYQKHNAGNSMYQNTGNGVFEDKTGTAGTAMGGWSWSCSELDFDNDGWSDIYVANGFISGPNPYDLQSFFWRQVAERSMTPLGADPDYEIAWNAINELVRSDYSWSGYQRNVFFANNYDGSFSEVSGALGLDWIDDSRAFGLADFDHDGRLEVVLKNRTAPQLRILRNDLEDIGNSIVIRLLGRESNRDAIGAVVTIESGPLRQVKFISAGSGFASQHTKELFFGLGETSQPISISVRWPTGKVVRYNSLPVNHRVQIEEGILDFKTASYKSRQATESTATSAAAALIAPSLPSGTVSTWLIAPLIAPSLRLADLNGQVLDLSALRGKPVLLAFVGAACDSSLSQLAFLEKASGELATAGLALFAVAMSSQADRAGVESLVRSSRASFPIHLADEQAAGAWMIQYRYLFDRRRDMSLPVSFLIDVQGAIVRVYSGVVAPQSVIDDVRSIPATVEECFARAVPFPGPYYGAVLKHDYLSFGIAFSEYGYADEAQASFQCAIDDDPTRQVAWFNLGTIYLNKKTYPEARKCLTEAVRLNPKDADAWNNLGSISGTEGKYDEALEQFKRAVLADSNHWNAVQNILRIYQSQGRVTEAQKAMEELIVRAPDNAGLHLALAITLESQNDLKRAREELETSIRLRAANPDAINNLGALLLRMGQPQQALELFEKCRRIAPDFDRAVVNSATLYKRAGQQERALQLLQDFLSRHPNNADVRAALNKMERE